MHACAEVITWCLLASLTAGSLEFHGVHRSLLSKTSNQKGTPQQLDACMHALTVAVVATDRAYRVSGDKRQPAGSSLPVRVGPTMRATISEQRDEHEYNLTHSCVVAMSRGDSCSGISISASK